MAEPTKRKLVLIAEDDDAIRTMLEKALGSRYAVESAADGNAALARLASSPTPDLLLCDVMMPGADGLTVARKMRALPNAKSIPVIFLTAKGGPKDVIAGIQAGAKQYVTKPFQIADLLAKVARILGP